MKTLLLHRARLTAGAGTRLEPVSRCVIRFPNQMPRFDPAKPTANEETMAREAGELYAFLQDVLPTGTLYRLEQLIRNQKADDRQPIDAEVNNEGET